MDVRRPGLLDAELQERERLTPSGGSFNFKYNATCEATLTIPEDGPAVKMHDWIALYGLHGFLGVYRVVNIAQAVGRQIQLSLLHGIDILSDSVWEPATVGAAEETFTGSMTQYLTALLAHQTHLITIGDDAPVRPWVLGTCESSEVVNKKISYNRLSDLLADVVPEGGDYELTFDMTVFPWRVNLVEKDGAVAGEFRAAHNMSGVTITYNDADLCTRLVLSNTHGSASKVKIYEAGAIAQTTWGIVTKTASIDTNDDLTAQAWPEADAWAETFFALHAQPSVQVQVEGEDLSAATGDTWDEASLGRMVRVPLPDYGFTVLARAVAIDQPDPYGQPERVVVSLANSLPQFSEQIKIIEKTASSAYGRAGSAAQKAEEADEKADEVIYRTDYTKTDRGIGMLAQAIGVKIDPTTHLPLYNETTGEYAFEGNNGATLTGHLSIEAAKVISEVTVARGDFTELGSRLTQMAGDIEAKVSAVDLDAKCTTAGFIKIQAANDAAKAVVGASFLDSNGNLSAAKIIAQVNADGSTVKISANKVNIDGDTVVGWLAGKSISATSFTGTTGNITTLTTGTLKLTQGASTVDVARKAVTIAGVLQSNIEVLATGSDTALAIPNAVASIAANSSAPSGQIGITVTPLNGSAYDVNFNIAATQYYIDGVAAAKSAALAGVTVSGWEPTNGANSAIQNLVKDGDNNLLHTITIPAQVTSGDGLYVSVGAFNSSDNATVTVYPKLGGVSCAPIATATVNDSQRISNAQAAGASAALQGVNLAGWQLNNGTTENYVRDGSNNTLQTVSLPPSANWDINVGAFNSSGSATITVRNVFSGSYSNPVKTGTISDSNLQPGNIKDGVSIFGIQGTYTGGGGGYTGLEYDASTGVISLSTTSTTTSLTVTATVDGPVYYSGSHTYKAQGHAKIGSTTIASSSLSESGTQAYQAGQSAGYSHSAVLSKVNKSSNAVDYKLYYKKSDGTYTAQIDLSTTNVYNAGRTTVGSTVYW